METRNIIRVETGNVDFLAAVAVKFQGLSKTESCTAQWQYIPFFAIIGNEYCFMK